MPRNLDRRVEIIFPVEQPALKEAAKHILSVELADNTKANLLGSDGLYTKVDKRGKVLVNSQEQFCREAEEAAPVPQDARKDRVFIPAEPVESE